MSNIVTVNFRTGKRVPSIKLIPPENSQPIDSARLERIKGSLERINKPTDQTSSSNRRPSYVSNIKGTSSSDENINLGDRISRIKSSLDRINKLMQDLREMR